MAQHIDPERIEEELLNLSRTPFRRLLAKLLKCADDITDEELLAFAKKFPDRLFQATAICGKLAGYSDKHELSGDLPLTARLKGLSDMELRALQAEQDVEMLKLMGQKGSPGPPPKNNGSDVRE